MLSSMENEHISKPHHQFTDEGYDYVAFEVRCGTCGLLLFQFVHRQQPPGPLASATSWYKPAVKVIHRDDYSGISHGFESVATGEDRNQVVTSRQMNRFEFEKWMEPKL